MEVSNLAYDISGFGDWLNESDEIVPFEKLGLKENAPPEAVKAFEEYCKVKKWADKIEEESNAKRMKSKKHQSDK